MNVAVLVQDEIDKIMGEEPKVDGEIHDERCFIVTTHSPDRDWQPVSKPYTCFYCIRDFGTSGAS